MEFRSAIEAFRMHRFQLVDPVALPGEEVPGVGTEMEISRLKSCPDLEKCLYKGVFLCKIDLAL